MKQAKIYAVPSNTVLAFYYAAPGTKPVYLYSVRSSKSLLEYFAHPQTERQILSYHKWGNYARDHQIEKLPSYIKYAKAEIRDALRHDLEHDSDCDYEREAA